jgi:hypothetical protein
MEVPLRVVWFCGEEAAIGAGEEMPVMSESDGFRDAGESDAGSLTFEGDVFLFNSDELTFIGSLAGAPVIMEVGKGREAMDGGGKEGMAEGTALVGLNVIG